LSDEISKEAITTAACIFCGIVNGAAPTSIAYADERAVAFMDILPVNERHLLVVPRVHAASLADLDARTGCHLFRWAVDLSKAMWRSGVRCEGVNLFFADGEAAGQEIFRVHLHVIPRFRGDGFGLRFGPEYYDLPGRLLLDEVAARIRRAMEG
jgi:histidine triad (HIT) family protein